MQITSSAFSQGAVIPDEFTCKGDNKSPQISWSDPPAGTQSLALIVEDPDAPAGTYTHWIAYNISPLKKSLPAHLQSAPHLEGLMQGKNDFGHTGYGGPCPPKGDKAHRYFFRIYALDTRLDLPPGAGRQQLEEAMLDHIIGQGELMGKYSVH